MFQLGFTNPATWELLNVLPLYLCMSTDDHYKLDLSGSESTYDALLTEDNDACFTVDATDDSKAESMRSITFEVSINGPIGSLWTIPRNTLTLTIIDDDGKS